MKKTLHVFLFLFLLNNVAFADDYTGFFIAPGVGAMNFDNDWDVDDSPFYSLGLGYRINKRYAVEGNLFRVNSKEDQSGRDGDATGLRLDILYGIADFGQW